MYIGCGEKSTKNLINKGLLSWLVTLAGCEEVLLQRGDKVEILWAGGCPCSLLL